jgi:hypothetical protein
MFPVLPLGFATFVVSGAIDLDRYGPMPATPTFADQPRIEQPYRDGPTLVGLPYLNPDSADQACPRGYEIRRQEARNEGDKQFLVWTLRCR